MSDVRCLRACAVLLALQWTCGVAAGREAALPPRWEEPVFRLSLQPPAGATVTEGSRDAELLTMRTPEGIVVRFRVRATGEPLGIDAVARHAIKLMKWSHPTCEIMEQRLAMTAGRPGARLCFRVRDNDPAKAPWVLVQALIMLDERTVGVLHMDSDLGQIEQGLAVFDQIAASMTMPDSVEVQRQREEALKRSEAFLARLTPAAISSVLGPEQWLRIIENDIDVGYMRLKTFRDTEMNLPGVRVDMQVRLFSGEQAVDTLGNFFLADHGRTEFWSVRTTVRPMDPRLRVLGAPEGVQMSEAPTWAETGLRSDDEITVTLQTPSGRTEHKWNRPPVGYLPHALQRLIPLLLPRDAPRTYAFYSYFPNATSLVLRTEQVAPRPGGGFEIITKAAPTDAEAVAEYDATGRLIRQRLSDGRIALPSTPGQIKAILQLR